jgi:hypothetical protein
MALRIWRHDRIGVSASLARAERASLRGLPRMGAFRSTELVRRASGPPDAGGRRRLAVRSVAWDHGPRAYIPRVGVRVLAASKPDGGGSLPAVPRSRRDLESSAVTVGRALDLDHYLEVLDDRLGAGFRGGRGVGASLANCVLGSAHGVFGFPI